MPLGHNKLNSMVKIMMREAGVEGYYTNHSLRATAFSRSFQNDGHDKLIKGVTGHRSDALQGYKRETEEQHLKVSKIVQGQKDKRITVKEISNSPRTGDSVGWAAGCHAGGREFDSDRTNTQGLNCVRQNAS